MKQIIRDATPADMDAVWALNQSEVPHVGSMTLDEMHNYLEIAAYFRLACDDVDNLLAFLVGLGPGADYGSLNYRWFSERYERFAYIDRIAVARRARRRGIAAALYEDFACTAKSWSPTLCCEVNLLPPNPGSMAFHQRIGFRQVDTLESKSGSKMVAMLIKNL